MGSHYVLQCSVYGNDNNNNNLDWGPVPRLSPESTAASVADCAIPRFLNVPPLSARCL